MAAPATKEWLGKLPSAIDTNQSPLPLGLAVIKLTCTANFDFDFCPEHPLWAMAIGGDGNDGAGTLTLQASVDGTNFYALPTSVSLTAAGIASVARNDLGYPYYRLTLTGSTTPTLVSYITMWAANS